MSIIGGGIAGLTAAYQLTRTRVERSRWDVTVYEMGHKWGGRLASAHRPGDWGRNEEHGLHVWFGFYDNTLRMAEEVWEDAPRHAACPWANVWDALRPIHTSDHGLVTLGGAPEIWRLHHPPNAARPGQSEITSPVALLTGLVERARALARSLGPRGGDDGAPAARPPPFSAAKELGWLRNVEQRLGRIAAAVASMATPGAPPLRREAGRLVERLVASLQPGILRLARLAAGDDLGRQELVAALDIALTTFRIVASPRHGIVVDGDLDRVSSFELRDLLRWHGASESTLRSRFLEAVYDMPFAFADGDRARPVLEASTALRFSLRIAFNYKYAIAYLLSAGAGETFIAPLYALLRARGVTFRPFHRLESIAIDETNQVAETIRLVRAARPIADYEPLVERNGLWSFKADPDWAALRDGEALLARGVDFYSRWSDRGEREVIELHHGADFDDVVLALPLGCIKRDADGWSPVAAWLDRPHVQRCLGRLHLVPTVAAQLWFNEPAEALGLRGRAVVTWQPPFSVACDMTPVIKHERWPKPGPGASVYLCGPWPLTAHRAPAAAGDAPRADLARARAMLVEQVNRVGHTLWGAATLYAPEKIEPWAAQYVRVNVEPWDLADLALPGADAVRLEAADSGLRNMALAGSWTRTPLNTTSVEAAVCSGIAAARALGARTQAVLAESFLRRPPSRVLLPGREALLAQARSRSSAKWPQPVWTVDP